MRMNLPTHLFRSARYVTGIWLVFLAPALFGASAGEKADSLVQAGNRHYTAHRYVQAESCYKEALAMGYTSAPLYFNLGNACYKQKEISLAILYYEKARLLAPGDEDIKLNLAMANSRIVDKIETIPVFFVRRWINALAGSFMPDTWAWLALVMFVLALAAFFAYVISGRTAVRKAGFLGGVLLLLFCISSLMLMKNRKNLLLNSHGAIVMSPVVNAKSSPDDQGTSVFVMHEGTHVMKVDSLQNWKEIRIPDGNKGWVPDSVLADI
jgi:tetratricopeptide (TPR) repeat protein